MPDFLNALIPLLFVFLGTILTLFVVRGIVLRHMKDEKTKGIVKKAFVTAFIVICVFFGYRFFTYVVVNEAPQSVIDRSDVNRQIREFDQRIHDDRDNNNH